MIPEAFEFLFHEFSDTIKNEKFYNGYRLIACDGSDVNIAHNPKDEDTYFQTLPTDKGFNQLHLNVFYDLCNRSYTDAIIQTGRKEHEFKACVDMIGRSKYSENVILIADRGYENYNIFAHAEVKGWNFVIRVKDKNSNGIVSGLNIAEEGSFDKDISYLLTRRQTKEVKEHPEKYKFMPTNQKFDYLPAGDQGTYSMNFRVVRFLIAENSYETIITNLDTEQFPPSKIKELYALRWGIETSFRELKYAIGLTTFMLKSGLYQTRNICKTYVV